MRVLAIIPAFNEEETIASVIKELNEYRFIDIIVINDGSDDNTYAITHSLNVNFVDFPLNKGIGTAMKVGYQFAKHNGYDIAVQIDADGQHDISRLNDLILLIKENNYDMVIGSRYVVKTNYVSSFLRYWGSKYFTFLINVLSQKIIKDTTSGFRAVNKTIIKIFADNYPSYYPEVPTLLELLMENYKICETSVEMKKRQGGKSSISFAKSIKYLFEISFICVKKWSLIKKRIKDERITN
ncbi:MAG: glycosyltransferase family 2 protein [Lachnospiraceae bacterium]|nr:glycosyltransferase family 2 protein [Lachnospiraceae bacterium]